MGFKNKFPDYETYDDSHFYMKEIPPIMDSLHGLIVRHCNGDRHILKAVVNIILSHVPTEVTSNWGWDWLIEDLESALRKIYKAKFHRFMDAIIEVTECLGSDFQDELNEILDENDFGYYIESWLGDYEWFLKEDGVAKTQEIITEATETIKDTCTKTEEHLRQILENLKQDTQRARKDAVRDALSAMETLLKKLSGEKDIEQATKWLRDQGWGTKTILRDGVSIWNNIHKEYPDVRHGNPEGREMEKEEALYWIERIITFINYINRRHKS